MWRMSETRIGGTKRTKGTRELNKLGEQGKPKEPDKQRESVEPEELDEQVEPRKEEEQG